MKYYHKKKIDRLCNYLDSRNADGCFSRAMELFPELVLLFLAGDSYGQILQDNGVQTGYIISCSAGFIEIVYVWKDKEVSVIAASAKDVEWQLSYQIGKDANWVKDKILKEDDE